MLHNYFHWLKPGATHENEFLFRREGVTTFIQSLLEFPLDFINIFFSYFGHYGVQVFLFLSGYGLYLAYNNTSLKWWSFVKKRLQKLYPSFLMAIFIYLTINIIRDNMLPGWVTFRELIYKVLLIHTFLPGRALTMVGMWWFYSLIVQLYLVFPFFIKLFKRHGELVLWGLILLSYTLTILMSQNIISLPPHICVHMSFIGHIPEFLLGVILASRKELKLNWILLLVAIAVFTIGNFNEWVWYFSFLAMCYLFLFSVALIRNIKIKMLTNFFSFMGRISMYLFAVHGVLRMTFFLIAKEQTSGYKMYVSIYFILFSVLAALVMEKGETYLKRRFFTSS